MINLHKEVLFRNDISIDCEQKERSIDREIDFFDENEFMERMMELFDNFKI